MLILTLSTLAYRQSCHRAGNSVWTLSAHALSHSIRKLTGNQPVLQKKSFVIAATEHLHRRIARMGDRIRELEDALAVLQASHSPEPHPLLSEGSIFVDTDK